MTCAVNITAHFMQPIIWRTFHFAEETLAPPDTRLSYHIPLRLVSCSQSSINDICGGSNSLSHVRSTSFIIATCTHMFSQSFPTIHFSLTDSHFCSLSILFSFPTIHFSLHILTFVLLAFNVVVIVWHICYWFCFFFSSGSMGVKSEV